MDIIFIIIKARNRHKKSYTLRLYVVYSYALYERLKNCAYECKCIRVSIPIHSYTHTQTNMYTFICSGMTNIKSTTHLRAALSVSQPASQSKPITILFCTAIHTSTSSRIKKQQQTRTHTNRKLTHLPCIQLIICERARECTRKYTIPYTILLTAGCVFAFMCVCVLLLLLNLYDIFQTVNRPARSLRTVEQQQQQH